VALRRLRWHRVAAAATYALLLRWLQVWTHNYPSGNYGPPAGFNFDWGSQDPPIVVSARPCTHVRAAAMPALRAS
jgi:hypothetical protein